MSFLNFLQSEHICQNLKCVLSTQQLTACLGVGHKMLTYGHVTSALITQFLFVVEPCYSEERGHVTFSLPSLVIYKYVLPCLELLFKGSWEKCSEDRYSKYYICWICYAVCLVGWKCRLDELLFITGARGQDKWMPALDWLIDLDILAYMMPCSKSNLRQYSPNTVLSPSVHYNCMLLESQLDLRHIQ